MVHLASIKKDDDFEPIVNRVDSIKLDTVEEDDYSATVYGTRFATQQLPHAEMPDREMPREVAYRMIKDELSLDGNPMLKYGPEVKQYTLVLTLAQLGEFCHYLHGTWGFI